MRNPIIVEGKVIGVLEDNVFSKQVIEAKHLMWTLDAWGIDKEVFDKLLTTALIRITDEKGKVYEASGQMYLKHGVVRDRGHRLQIFLSRRYFDKPDSNPKLSL